MKQNQQQRLLLLLEEAALKGDTKSLLEIHKQNPTLLDRVLVSSSFDETPLHVAALRGHVAFVNHLLRLNPDLAGALDSEQSTPLHLSAAKGYLPIVEALVSAKPDSCAVPDRHGLTPLHIAAMKGQVEVLRVLVGARPDAARAVVNQRQTILHLCVNHCQMEALKVLMETIDDDLGLMNATDEYGNTTLHLAVADKQIKTVEYLLKSGKVDVNAKNANGYTAMDILAQSRRGVQDWDIGNALQEAGAQKSASIPLTAIRHSTPLATQGTNPQTQVFAHNQASTLPGNGNNPQIPSFLRLDPTKPSTEGDKSQDNLTQGEWLSKKRDALMVVASLLATMAFQAGVSPPGGVWQQDGSLDSQPAHRYRAGEAVAAYNYEETYKYYLRANTIGFVASLSTILLLISGLPFKRRVFMWFLMVIMWLSITSMAFTYAFSIVAVTPRKDRGPLRHTMYIAVPVWCGVMALLLFGHTFRLTQRWLNSKRRKWKSSSGKSSGSVVAANRGNGNLNVEIRRT